jgi:putative endonuclease
MGSIPVRITDSSLGSMVFIYVIRSQIDGRFYVGMTTDVENRLREHNNGKTRSTKGFRPWSLVFVETFGSRKEARTREVFLKGGSGKEAIKRYWEEAQRLNSAF